ncbi:helix-turn-helix domain containing protein [Candidatus Haliotispira prima]|uniref:Helix-turn-helix domain containing protein n=1 Tax=Candidatus Haliotispira prima TaxID=3034016 RepID=A0ABY8MK24_9SPIO|nr:helix-turn-helix domain containing protein [Candidatus Haliotispira prima]
MPKKIDHEQRKQEILREALELFSSKGYEATTLADIAKAAHIARPTLYQYFRNKHQLLFFASKQFTDQFLVYYHKIVDLRHISAAHRLRFILSHIVLSCREKRRELVSQSAFILKLEQEGRSIGGLVHKRTKPLKSLLFLLIEEAQQNQQLRCWDLNETVDMLLTLVTSGIVHVLLFPDEDCAPVLRHIVTVLTLLAGQVAEAEAGTRTEIEAWDEAYEEVHRELLSLIEEMRQRDAVEKAKAQHGSKNNHAELMDAEEDVLDDEWNAFLDPFRAME